MKRISSGSTSFLEDLPYKVKNLTTSSPKQAFHISRDERQKTTTSSILPESKILTPEGSIYRRESRVGASSKVNFTKLTTSEQYLRYKNLAIGVKDLKEEFNAYISKGKMATDFSLQQALEKIHNTNYDLEDQRMLIENLSKAVTTGCLVPNTLGYNQICTILRDILGLSYKDSHPTIMFPDKELAISRVEYKVYKELFCTIGILKAMVGREKKRIENPNDFLRILNNQINLLRESA